MVSELEVSSVARGHRPCAWQTIAEDQFPRFAAAWAEMGLISLPILRVRNFTGFAHRHEKPQPGERANVCVIVARTLKDALRFKAANASGDNDTQGELLGFPKCCRTFFSDAWAGGYYDPIWQIAENTVKKEEEKNEKIHKAFRESGGCCEWMNKNGHDDCWHTDGTCHVDGHADSHHDVYVDSPHCDTPPQSECFEGDKTIWQMREGIISSRIEHFEGKKIKLWGSDVHPFANPLLRYAGIRVGFHLPCAFDCQETIAVAAERMDLAKETDPNLADILHGLLSMPMSWDVYHGIAVVRTPIFYLIVPSVPVAERHVVEVVSEPSFIPKESAKGMGFPFLEEGKNDAENS
jgi:hypothetical protein